MEWLTQNWIWLLIFGIFIGMHVFGHGCHGKHKEKDKNAPPDKNH